MSELERYQPPCNPDLYDKTVDNLPELLPKPLERLLMSQAERESWSRIATRQREELSAAITSLIIRRMRLADAWELHQELNKCDEQALRDVMQRVLRHPDNPLAVVMARHQLERWLRISALALSEEDY